MESVQRLLGLLALETDAPDEALRSLRISHMLSELLREQFPADTIGLSRSGFSSRREYVNSLIVELLVEKGAFRDALNYVELGKARAVKDLLSSRDSSDVEDAGSAGRDLSAVLGSWPLDKVAVEYYLGERKAYVFLIKSGGEVNAWVLRNEEGAPLSSRELVTSVRIFLSSIENHAAVMRSRLLSGQGFDNHWQDELNSLYVQLIPAEARESLNHAGSVIIIPHHILHYFPFAALVVEKDLDGASTSKVAKPKFLLDESCHLLYAPSLLTWDRLHQRPKKSQLRANAIGLVDVPGMSSLPGVRRDLNNFRVVFGDAVKSVVEGDDATPESAMRLMREPGILLIATHGFNNPDQPLESLLMLQSDRVEPSDKNLSAAGHLTVRDILGTQVNCSMVVMSACYSGLGDRSPLPGDDVFGLQRAFLMSGTRTVVSGLWDVYDGTAPDLIRGYFAGVKAGRPASQALADSQRELLQRLRSSRNAEPFLHPYFWAVYTVAGDD